MTQISAEGRELLAWLSLVHREDVGRRQVRERIIGASRGSHDLAIVWGLARGLGE